MILTLVPGGEGGSDPGPEAGSSEHSPHEHRSSWPLVAALGAAGLYVGFALVSLAYSAGTVPALLGLVVAVGGLAVAVAGLVGWLSEAFLRARSKRVASARSRELYVTTMVLFLMTDLGTFGAGFVYYAFVRVGTWPPPELPPLLGSLVIVNTAVLVASSVAFHVAHGALERGDERRFRGFLGLTVLLGAIFLGGQAYEYYEFVVAEGFTIGDGVFASAFFGLTGLHGLHVALGVALLALVFARALRGHYGPDRDTSIATVGLYWHFVDAVWLFLVAVLYVGAAVTL